MSNGKLFRSSPFIVTADPDVARFWAGRPNVLRRLNRMLNGLKRRPDSTLDVIWANYGAGKSHTLYYLASQIEDQNPSNICVVVEILQQVRNFMDLYRRVMAGMPIERIAEVLISEEVNIGRDDLSKALRIIKHGGGTEKITALQWLKGERPHLKILKDLTGIPARIEDGAMAGDVLSSLISAMGSAGMRFCLMLDEFERTDSLPDKVKSQIHSTLRTLISANPLHLSLYLTISSKMEQTAMDILPDELKTIMGMRPTISLPEMDKDEAYNFVKEKFFFLRPEGFSDDPLAPFGREVVLETIDTVARANGVNLTPRNILLALGYLYDEMPPEDNGTEMSVEEARELLSELNWGGHAEDG